MKGYRNYKRKIEEIYQTSIDSAIEKRVSNLHALELVREMTLEIRRANKKKP